MKTKNSFFIVTLIILGLNTLWEFSHYFLYVDLSGISKYPHLIIASFTDTFILLGIFAIISLKNKTLNWIKSPKKSDYILTIILGLVIALSIEAINLNLGRWAYTATMPTVFGIGLSPLIQLALTGVISLKIVNKTK